MLCHECSKYWETLRHKRGQPLGRFYILETIKIAGEENKRQVPAVTRTIAEVEMPHGSASGRKAGNCPPA
jgi:hypothetical protein